MKKQLLLLAFILIAPICLLAQSRSSTVYSLQTRYLEHQLDSTERSSLMALLREYHEKVTMKNEFVKSERTMFHYWTVDSRELITITEFADWSAIEKAGDRDMELEAAAWPDPKQRSEFMKKMSAYFTHHKDAIYSALPLLTK